MNLIMLKLFVAVIMDGYSAVKDRDQQLFNEERVDQFNQVWYKFDKEVRSKD